MLDPLEEVPESVKTVKAYLGDYPFPSAVYTREEWNREVADANPTRALIRRDLEALIAKLE